MRRPLACLTVAVLGCPGWAAAQAPVRTTLTIEQATRREGRDEVVTIAGRASASTGQMQSRVLDIAMQDGTGGIRVFSRTLRTAVTAGDSVVATGRLRRYRGDLELIATGVDVVPAPRRVIVPYALPIAAPLMEEHSGQVVRIHGRVTRTGVSEGGQWARLSGVHEGRPDSLTVWVPANHGAPIRLVDLQPADSVIVTGIVSAYQDNPEDAVVWQVIPRDTADVIVADASRSLPDWLGTSALAGLLALGAAILVGRYTARRQISALRETDARYRQLLALSPDAVIVHARGRICFANPAASHLLGIDAGTTLVGRPLEEYVHPDSRAELHAASDHMTPELAAAATRFRVRFLTADGGTADAEVTSSPCVYHDKRAMVLLARDITAQLRYERDLHALALVDGLTGLQNRRGFSLFAEQELARARRSGRTPVLVFADLDGLKQINDAHGHAAGDDALRLAARALKSVLRESDIIARWSGDEFVALMGEGGDVVSETIAERLNTALAALAPEGQPFTVTASIGMTTLAPELPLNEAMERADAQLYADKKRDRNSDPRGQRVTVDADAGTR